MKAWMSPQICNRNLHISFTMGCREDFFNKTQKTGGRGGFCPCSVELGLKNEVSTAKMTLNIEPHRIGKKAA